MKKFKVSILLVIIMICVSNVCYAHIAEEKTFVGNVIGTYAELVGYVYILIPLIILYGILVIRVIKKNKEKTKKFKIKKSLVLILPMLLLSIAIGWINQVVINNIDTTIKYGYTDTKMCTLIEPKFDYAEDFYNGVAKIGVKKQRGGIGNDRQFYYYQYGFINIKGDIIVETVYDELSGFNNSGYAYGAIKSGWGKYGAGQFYKIDQNGNTEEITSKEYYENKNTNQTEKDKLIMLKKNVDRKVDIKYMVLDSILPLIISLIAILIILVIFKKEEKSSKII